MKLSSLLSLGSGALAVGTSLPKLCISDADVGTYVGAFQQVLSKSNGFEQTANNYFSDQFQAVSDSDSFFEQRAPLNSTLFPSRGDFISYIKTKSGANFTTLFTAHDCKTITWYAEFRPGGIPARIMQIFFIDTIKNQISKVYYEYNTGILLYLQGCTQNRTINIGKEGIPNQAANCLGVF